LQAKRVERNLKANKKEGQKILAKFKMRDEDLGPTPVKGMNLMKISVTREKEEGSPSLRMSLSIMPQG